MPSSPTPPTPTSMPMYKNEIERLKQQLLETEDHHFHALPVPPTTYSPNNPIISTERYESHSTTSSRTPLQHRTPPRSTAAARSQHSSPGSREEEDAQYVQFKARPMPEFYKSNSTTPPGSRARTPPKPRTPPRPRTPPKSTTAARPSDSPKSHDEDIEYVQFKARPMPEFYKSNSTTPPGSRDRTPPRQPQTPPRLTKAHSPDSLKKKSPTKEDDDVLHAESEANERNNNNNNNNMSPKPWTRRLTPSPKKHGSTENNPQPASSDSTVRSLPNKTSAVEHQHISSSSSVSNTTKDTSPDSKQCNSKSTDDLLLELIASATATNKPVVVEPVQLSQPQDEVGDTKEKNPPSQDKPSPSLSNDGETHLSLPPTVAREHLAAAGDTTSIKTEKTLRDGQESKKDSSSTSVKSNVSRRAKLRPSPSKPRSPGRASDASSDEQEEEPKPRIPPFKARPIPKSHKVPHVPHRRQAQSKKEASTLNGSSPTSNGESAIHTVPAIATAPSDGSMSFQSALSPCTSEDVNFPPSNRNVASKLGLEPNAPPSSKNTDIFRSRTPAPASSPLTQDATTQHVVSSSSTGEKEEPTESPSSTQKPTPESKKEDSSNRSNEPDLDYLLGDDVPFKKESNDLLEMEMNQKLPEPSLDELLADTILSSDLADADESEEELILLASSSEFELDDKMPPAVLGSGKLDSLLDPNGDETETGSHGIGLLQEELWAADMDYKIDSRSPDNNPSPPDDNDSPLQEDKSLSPKSSYDGVDILQAELEQTNLLSDILTNTAIASRESNGSLKDKNDSPAIRSSPATSSSSREIVSSFEAEAKEKEQQPKVESLDTTDGDLDQSMAILTSIPVAMFFIHLVAAMVLPYVLALTVLEIKQKIWGDVSTAVVVEPPLIRNASAPIMHQEEVAENEKRLPMLTKQPRRKFPLPTLPKGKKPPRARYTSKCFVPDGETAVNEEVNPIASSSWSQHRINVHLHHHNDTEDTNPYVDSEGEGVEGLYEPAGQHLLLDISNVDPYFLLDMEVLAGAMIAVTERSQLTLLSYHCHEWKGPKGVSCMGVLLESHISLHTWPSAGILSLDLFTCGSQSLLPLVPLIQELFGVALNSSEDNAPSPLMRWLHKKRGFRGFFEAQGGADETNSVQEPRKDMPAELGSKSVDLEAFLLGWMGYSEKTLLANLQTPFQQVQIYEASLMAAPPLSRQSSNESVTFGSNKMVYLDGVMKSSLHGMEAYHEALVQPALMAHKMPHRVAILGGAEGATLREVLKHSSVKEVVMVEIDEMLFDLSRTYLPEWNDCSDFIAPLEALVSAATRNNSSIGETGSCFDDPRTKLYVEDAISWFTTRYGNKTAIKEEDKFDVIIMDALDPSTLITSFGLEIADKFFFALTRALGPDGILVSQVGPIRSDKAVEEVAQLLQAHGAQKMISYSESHGQLMAPYEFRMLSMSADTSFKWPLEASASELNLHFTKRAATASSSASPFHYFDAPTFLSSYQHPSRLGQEIFCQEHGCDDSSAFDPESINIPSSALELAIIREPFFVRGMGVFAQKQRWLYPKGSYLLLDEMTDTFEVGPKSLQLLTSVSDVLNTTKHRLRFIQNECQQGRYVACNVIANRPQILLFVVCRPDADPEENRTHKVVEVNKNSFFNPYADRHGWASFATSKANRLPMDVQRGSEIFLEC